MSNCSFYLIFAFYFLTRLLNLTGIPIFNDEAIYLHWGQIMVNSPGQAFYSLFDGKPPLILWLYGYFLKLPFDPLISARLVSILAGTLALLGLFRLLKQLGMKERVQNFTAILYITNPLTLFFDRLAVLDTWILVIFVWFLYYSFKIFQSKKTNWLDIFILGIILGSGLWIKGNANFFLYLPFLIPILTFILKKDLKIAANSFIAYLASFLLAQLIFLPIRFQPLFQDFSKREGDFLLPLSEAILPVNWLSHFQVLSLTFLIYITPLVLVLAIITIKENVKEKPITILTLFFFSFLPLAFELFMARYFLSRYYLFTLLPILIFAGMYLGNLKKFPKLIPVVTFLLPSIISFLIIFYPRQTIVKLSFSNSLKQDMPVYLTSWPSGYGVKEAADWLNLESQKNPLILLTRADSGNPEDSILVYLSNNKNIASFQINRPPTEEELASVKNLPVYYVSRGEQYLGMKDRLQEVRKYYKPNDNEFVGIYRLQQ